MIEIKFRRFHWAGHFRSYCDGRVARLVWEETPTRKRPLGRPRLRWRYNVGGDLKAMGVENWVELAKDKRKLRPVVKSAKTHTGL